MLDFFKRCIARGVEYNKLSIAFFKLYDVIGKIKLEHEMSIGDDEEKLSDELILLAIWIRENIFDVLEKSKISLEEKIYVHGFIGLKEIKYFMNGTVAQVIRLSVEAGINDDIQGILNGDDIYYDAKKYIKNNYPDYL